MFTVLGEALLDMVQPAPGDLYRALPAGGPLNIAVGLRRLGHPVSMMARISTGALGARIRRYAIDNELDLSASVATEEQVTLAFATIDDAGRASYDFYVQGTADWGWTGVELAALPIATQALHTGSLATAVQPGAELVTTWWAELSAGGRVLLSFDPNVRPSLAGGRDDAVRRIERLVALSHLVKASDEDLGWLYPDEEPADVLTAWARLGPSLVVLTRGPHGCLGASAGAAIVVELPAPQIAVVDTIGAGDAFQSGLLSALADADRLSPSALRTLTEDDLRRTLQRGLDVAALTCQRAGADPPTRGDYDATITSGSPLS